jgi:hypothetical protein
MLNMTMSFRTKLLLTSNHFANFIKNKMAISKHYARIWLIKTKNAAYAIQAYAQTILQSYILKIKHTNLINECAALINGLINGRNIWKWFLFTPLIGILSAIAYEFSSELAYNMPGSSQNNPLYRSDIVAFINSIINMPVKVSGNEKIFMVSKYSSTRRLDKAIIDSVLASRFMTPQEVLSIITKTRDVAYDPVLAALCVADLLTSLNASVSLLKEPERGAKHIELIENIVWDHLNFLKRTNLLEKNSANIIANKIIFEFSRFCGLTLKDKAALKILSFLSMQPDTIINRVEIKHAIKKLLK